MLGQRRRYGILWRYVAREFLLSFIVAFLFFFLIFFINQLLLMAKDILSRKAPFGDVARLVVYAMPAVIAMSFPFGSLVGALMSSGRLASDNEILVMHASGVPRSAVFVPFVVLGLVFSMVSFTMNDYFLPLGTINYGKLYRKLVTSTPALELKPYSVKTYRDTTMVTGPVDGQRIEDVVILDTTKGGASRVISAGSAELVDRGESSGVISLILKDVFVQESDPAKPERFEYSEAGSMEYNILLTSFSDFSVGISPREMSSVDVLKEIRVKEAALHDRQKARSAEIVNRTLALIGDYASRSAALAPLDSSVATLNSQALALRNLSDRPLSDRSLDIYRLEYFKKFSIPSGALFFVFLAFPLGSLARKSGRMLGFGIGLLVSVAYWGLLIAGQTLGLRSSFSPLVAMWAPNALVILCSLLLFISRRAA